MIGRSRSSVLPSHPLLPSFKPLQVGSSSSQPQCCDDCGRSELDLFKSISPKKLHKKAGKGKVRQLVPVEVHALWDLHVQPSHPSHYFVPAAWLTCILHHKYIYIYIPRTCLPKRFYEILMDWFCGKNITGPFATPSTTSLHAMHGKTLQIRSWNRNITHTDQAKDAGGCFAKSSSGTWKWLRKAKVIFSLWESCHHVASLNEFWTTS